VITCLVLQAGDHDGLAFESDARAAVLLAEARGGWTYVLLTVAGSSGYLLRASCLMPADLVAHPRAGEGGFFGSLERDDELVEPAPPRDGLRQDSSGSGSVDDEAFVYVEGRAGTDVASITVTTPRGREVEASIEHGHWAVWWPAGDASPNNPDLSDAPTYTVTVRDGNARPLASP
jgi:hypothetical protein